VAEIYRRDEKKKSLKKKTHAEKFPHGAYEVTDSRTRSKKFIQKAELLGILSGPIHDIIKIRELKKKKSKKKKGK
jgi:hypothetical protein